MEVNEILGHRDSIEEHERCLCGDCLQANLICDPNSLLEENIYGLETSSVYECNYVCNGDLEHAAAKRYRDDISTTPSLASPVVPKKKLQKCSCPYMKGLDGENCFNTIFIYCYYFYCILYSICTAKKYKYYKYKSTPENSAEPQYTCILTARNREISPVLQSTLFIRNI